jgi:signal transduction histidine kinase/CheY-like chemotaxis protein
MTALIALPDTLAEALPDTLAAARDELIRTRQIMELSHRIARIGLWELDLVDQRMSWSDISCEIHTVPSGHRPTLADALAHYKLLDGQERASAAVQAALAHGQPFDLELPLARADGVLQWVRKIGIAEHVNGRCTRLYGTVQDISVQVSVEQLRLIRARAEAANLAKSSFLTRISHELRTPLNAVLGFSHLLSTDPVVRASASAQGQVRHIQQAGRQLLALIDDVMDLSSSDVRQLRLRPEPVSLPALAANCLAQLQLQADTQGVALRLTCDPALPPLWADPMRLRQVLNNLIGNAIKYNRPGGLVTVALATSGTLLSVAVHDTGNGLNRARLAGLFQPFNRLGAEHGSTQGTGLGLVISQQLVQAMGGTLAVRSTPGEGSVFSVQWLLADASGPATPGASGLQPLPTRHPAASPDRPMLVLLVADDLALNTLVRDALACRHHLRLDQAGDGDRGLQALHALRPDLLLLHLDLPHGAGLQLLATLRADPLLAHTACVAITADAVPERVRRALAAGCIDVLVTPLPVDHLLGLVDRLCSLPQTQAG